MNTTETEAKVETLVQQFRNSELISIQMGRIARHYKVPLLEVQTALLNRQVLLAYALTDFEKEGSPEQFSTLLKSQNEVEIVIAKRMTSVVERASDAVSTAEGLLEEATRVLAKVQRGVFHS